MHQRDVAIPRTTGMHVSGMTHAGQGAGEKSKRWRSVPVIVDEAPFPHGAAAARTIEPGTPLQKLCGDS
jgi:hypothetical protein